MGEIIKESKNFVFTKAGQTISRRILLAEDDKPVQNIIYRFLEFMGFEVSLADNGIEALAVFIEGSFEIVLTDFNMPVMNGLSLAIQIKKRSPSTPIILLTGSERGGIFKILKGGPFYSVIFKPFKMTDLQRTVQGALSSRGGEHKGVEEG